MGMDVFRERRTEHSLTISQLDLVFAASPLPICVEDGQRIIYLNAKARTMLGPKGIASAVRQSASEFWSARGNTDAQRAGPLRKQIGENEIDSAFEFASWPLDLSFGPCTVTVFAATNPPNPENLQHSDSAVSRLLEEVESADLGVWFWSITSGQVRFNDRCARILGYTPAEIGQHISAWEKLLHPDDKIATLLLLKADPENRTSSYEAEHRLRCKSGEWKWVLSRGKVVEWDDNGLPLRAAGTQLDISSRKKAELALVESEQRFHAIFNQTFQFIGLLNREGILLEANQTALSFGGLTREDVVNRSVWETGWWTISRATQDRLRDSVARAAAGEFVRYEVDVWGAGKTVVSIDFSLRPMMNQAGDVDLIIAEGRDITELKRAQKMAQSEGEKKRLEAVLRSMTKGVVIADPEGNVLSMNPAALQLLGIPSEAHAQRPLLEFREFELRTLDGHVVPLSEWPLARALRGETFFAYELEVRKLDTDQCFIGSFGGAPVRDENGALILVVQTIRDVTRQHEIERALRQSNQEVERINASLHQLSGELLRLQDEERRHLARELHDGPVQTLSAAAMNLSVLSRSKSLPENSEERRLAQECLAWVKQSSEEMRSLSYLLHPPILEELGVTSALQGWIRGFADRTGLEIEIDLEETGRLGADSETALFRIVQEALGNVHRHSQSTGASIRLYRTEQSITLEIEDSGRGIPEGALANKSASHILGVGIRGMRERARQLGGELTIQSRPGWTLVRLILPARPAV